ncbi:MAG: metalloregulator ArsR/SmtB family transcription factor [Hahellaceae bacterium]|nr:metalloregulator ArsR/SmtB family transcription factor [Hahellaceae bacterium]MCP5169785.1 metalloregulator ArsR/SmtB family transcription factor [Hahellaceae bacterium]
MDALALFKSLADETRLKTLLLITAKGELCVCELMAALQDTQPKVSRHLAQLRKAGLLSDRRQGQWVYYNLHPELPEWCLRVLQQTHLNNQACIRDGLQLLEKMPNRPGSECC